MTGFWQRAVALAAGALLAGVVAVAIARPNGPNRASGTLPEPVGSSSGEWYEALTGVGSDSLPRRSACGYRLTTKTLGVSHPVLPCGARLYILYGSRQALTQVVDRGPAGPGRELDLTPALARLVHVRGIRRVEWAYARGDGG
jgi:hypothetical protein